MVLPAFKIDFDSKSWTQAKRFLSFEPFWRRHMEQAMHEIAKAAQEHMKPLTHVRPQTTGALEESLRFDVQQTGTGWKVNYYGNFYGNFVDEGSPFDIIWADAKGLKAFPIDKRFGTPFFSTYIHGVGKGNSPYASQLPTHFSQKTAEWLAEGEAEELALAQMFEFLNQVVIT